MTRESQAHNSEERSIRQRANLMERESKSSRTGLFMKDISRKGRLMASEGVSLLKVKFSKVNSAMIKWTDMGTSSGKMVLSMKVSGLEAKSLAKENSTGQMDRYMRENSKITSVMEPESCIIRAERGLKDSGRLEKRMADVSTLGRTGQGMVSFISMERSRARES